jgi:hypothetical protein
VLANAGFQLGDSQRLIVSFGQLTQQLDINFASGKDKANLTQTTTAISYQAYLGGGLLNGVELNGYQADTPSQDLADKLYTVETATLFEQWNDPRRVAGSRVSGLQGRLVLTPTATGTLRLGFGGERLTNDFVTGKQSLTRGTGSAEWHQYWTDALSFKAGADSGAAQSRYSLGLDYGLGDGSKIGIALAALRGRDGASDDNQLRLSWSYDFGGKSGKSSKSGMAGGSSTPAWGSLIDQMTVRPAFVPTQVVAKLDTTAPAVRRIVISKGSLPAGASIDPATGAVTSPLGVTVTGIANITRNGVAFTNTGQFSVSGSSLVVNPGVMIEPAAGAQDTYIVTANNQGGGTTTITVTVSKGSVKIDSITVGGADSTAPSTPATLTLGNTGGVAGFTNVQGITLTVADVTDPSGVSWFVSESATVPASGDGGWTGTKPTSFTLSAGQGSKNVYVYVKDNAGNVQATGKLTTITLDTVAPSKTAESLASVVTGGGSGTGTISFDEAVNQVTSISFKKTADNTAAGGTISVSGGLNTTTLNINYPVIPNLVGDDIYIQLVVKDNAGNSRTINTNNYTIF